MEDREIVELYWSRSERAITETADKYGKYCRTIALRILNDEQDSEECVNDAYLQAWNAIPPRRPERLGAFLGKLVRNTALNRYKRANAEKRGGGQVPLALEELAECIPGGSDPARAVDELALTQALERFLAGLPGETRKIFMRRYWYLSTVQEIAADLGLGESKVKMTLLRARNKLRTQLEQEGFLT